jgi:hypothetical protein
MRGAQLDFSLPIAVCAWCQPDPPAGEIGALSHGICLRHLKTLKLSCQGVQIKRRRRSRNRDNDNEGQLPL